MKTLQKSMVFAAITTALFAAQSCKPERTVADDNEIITTLSVIATDSATGEVKTFTFRDLDGTGSNPPVEFDTIKLASNSTYNVQLLLLDETKTPADTTSNEIAEKADEHLFFFTPAPASLLSVTITDHDSHNLPVGLLSIWRTGNAENGTIDITLRHQPGVKNGTYAPGDTDVEVDFAVVVE